MRKSFWSKDLLATGGPKYAALARGIAEAIEREDLHPGERLPTHRELARCVDVTVGTVSHAFRKLREKGLIRGEVGRGTFVSYRGPDRFEFIQGATVPLRANLRHNYPVATPVENAAIANTLQILRERGFLDATIDLSWASHEPRHRLAGEKWLKRIGAKASAECVHVHPGGHTALMTALLATSRPGDIGLAPALCYPGLKAIADRFAVQIEPVPVDDEGMVPAALDAACAKHSPAFVYCAPTVDNVSAATASLERRRALANVIKKRSVWLCEFEDTSFLMSRPLRPIQSFAPDRVLLVGDTTRALSLGMRTSYLLAPQSLNDQVRDAFGATHWLPVPLLSEVVTQWIEDGTADRLIAVRRSELAARHGMVKRILKGCNVAAHRAGHHLWLKLPRAQLLDSFVSAAEERGVGVIGADWFSLAGARTPAAVRACYGSARSRAELEWALVELSNLLPRTS